MNLTASGARSFLFRLAAISGLAVLAAGPVAQARAVDVPIVIVLDGECDDAYQLIATDPSSDLAPEFASFPATSWAELSTLWAANDADTLYLCVPLAPNYTRAKSSGEFGLAIDVTGDRPNSGSAAPRWPTGVSYAYTATLAPGATSPQIAQHVIFPDYVIRGNLAGLQDGPNDNDGWTELLSWTGACWQGGQNWGGIDSDPQVGSHVAYRDSTGLELSIPFTQVGAIPGTPILLQFYATRQEPQPFRNGAYDTLPSDVQAAGIGITTTQRILARFNPVAPEGAPAIAFSSGSYSANEGAGSAALTLTLSAPLTHSLAVSLTVVGGTASNQDFSLAQSVITLPEGSDGAGFSITLLDDNQVEGAETVIIMIERAGGAWIGGPATAVLTILDDDEAPATPSPTATSPATSTSPPPPTHRVWLALVSR